MTSRVARPVGYTNRSGHPGKKRAGIKISVGMLKTVSSLRSLRGRIGSRAFLTGWKEIGEYLGKGIPLSSVGSGIKVCR
jgi:hypothetical protein